MQDHMNIAKKVRYSMSEGVEVTGHVGKRHCMPALRMDCMIVTNAL